MKKLFILSTTLVFLVLISFVIYYYFPKSESVKEKETEPIANDWFFVQRAYPFDKINYGAYHEALEQAKVLKSESRNKSMQNIWTAAGPVNIGGRITDIEMHASDLNTIYAGTANGGVFKSPDQGATWNPIFDDQACLSIGDIAVAPSDKSILYVGTGEANSGGGSLTYDGIGMYKSIDQGATWSPAGLELSGNIARIVINPKDPNRVFAACTGKLFEKNPYRGVYRTNDGGTTWNNVLFLTDSTGCIDIAMDKSHPDTLYAAMWERVRSLDSRSYGGASSDIYRTFDGGATWTKLTNGLPSLPDSKGRIGISISESNPNIVYAVYADKIGYFVGVYKSEDCGSTWTEVNDSYLNSDQAFASYGWWFGRIMVDPTDPNTVFVIGFDLYKTTDGGDNWINITSPEGVHVDHHGLYIHPLNHNLVINGNDGGVYISQSGGTGWNHVETLGITQFYTCAVDNLHPERLYGGAQDNNVLRTTTGNSNDWAPIIGGDGFYVLVDPVNDNYIYAEYQYGALQRSTNGGNYFYSATSGISSADRHNWETPVVFNPLNPKSLYYGTNKLYKSKNRAVNWAVISPDLTNGAGTGNLGANFGTITAISVSPADTNIVYTGADDGTVYVSSNNGGNWTKISGSLPQRWVTGIATDTFNPDVCFIVFSGYKYNDFLSHIYMTTNRGSSWTDISGNLPEAPINKVIVDPGLSLTLYVGTDVGVYTTSDLGQTWSALGTGLANSSVWDMTLHNPSRTLVAATFGRSMYKIQLSPASFVTEISEKENVEIYPNPVKTNLNIKSQSDLIKAEYVIFNSFGVIVEVGFLNNNEIPTENLASGNYILRINRGKKVIKKEFVKE
jgi:photosystem II stability/assembly factor-like uncharacterized protein